MGVGRRVCAGQVRHRVHVVASGLWRARRRRSALVGRERRHVLSTPPNAAPEPQLFAGSAPPPSCGLGRAGAMVNVVCGRWQMAGRSACIIALGSRY